MPVKGVCEGKAFSFRPGLWQVPDTCEDHKLGASKETLLQSLKLPFHRLQVGATLVTGEGNGNPLQYSCLENPMDRGAWWVRLHRVAKSQT